MHSRMLVLRFSKDIVDKPIITNLVRDYNLTFNILKAQIFPRKEGMLVMELQGSRRDFEKGIKYLEKVGVSVEPVDQGILGQDEAGGAAAAGGQPAHIDDAAVEAGVICRMSSSM